ncbi:hypothetical protein [Mycobacterium alsense]|uniref:hypothetical protein n=1 Tax=Mycobacterium alsense TaxID=324058 RepID=UPI001F0A5E5F|nr:hypothetical protein [Mycobacterium alsense]
MTNPGPPPAAQSAPPPVSKRSVSNRLLVVAVVVVGLIAAAALIVGIVGLTRPDSTAVGQTATVGSPSPTFTPEQVASAKKELCSAYHVAARSVDTDTRSSDRALARISLANAAGMLDAATVNPALPSNDRDAARALASAYRITNAVSSVTDAASPLYQTTLDDAKRAADVMASICP